MFNSFSNVKSVSYSTTGQLIQNTLLHIFELFCLLKVRSIIKELYMTISEYEESLMLRYGVDATSIMSLKELADDLPASNIQPHIAGLTSVEAVVLTSRLLQELANN